MGLGPLTNMNKLLIAAALLLVPVVSFGSTLYIEPSLTGETYISILKKYAPETLRVSIDDMGRIYFKTYSGLGTAAHIDDESRLLAIAGLKKAVEWRDKARDSKLGDTTKELCAFGKRDKTNYLCLTFFSENGGGDSGVCIYLTDSENIFKKGSIRIGGKDKIQTLIDILEKVPASVIQLKENDKNAADVLR